MTERKSEKDTPQPEGNVGEEPRAKGLSRRDLLIGAGLGASALAVAGATHYLNNLPDDAIQGLIERGIAANNTRNPFEEDALHVITTGTGAPLPDPQTCRSSSRCGRRRPDTGF